MSFANQPDPRDAPSVEFIQNLRARHPTEPEIDRMLTRKMERRDGPSYSLVKLDTLKTSVAALLAQKIDGPFEISDERWLSGGASKIQMRFTLKWNDPAEGPTTKDLVVRMEPSESLNASSRLREFELLRELAGVVPVPKVHWVDDQGTFFPEPALIYAFSTGVAKPTHGPAGGVTGIGTYYPPELRKVLAPQFMRHLANIHAFAYDKQRLSSFSHPEEGSTQSALWQVNRTLRIWEEDRGEEFPLMDVAVNWLNRNLPSLDHAGIIHGDYRAGNFLLDESNGKITAVLDWERAYIGDRHRDLAWSTSRVVGRMAEDGKTYLVCGLLPLNEFFERYEEYSGLTVDRKTLHFYEILNRYQQVQTVLGTAHRVVRLAKSHQNIVISRLQSAAYLLAEELRTALEEG
jgi:aminoglycoside phosphotransferase (APT) family kinase protein